MSYNRKKNITARDVERARRRLKDKHGIINKDLSELTSVAIGIKNNIFKVVTDGDCAGFQMNVGGNAVISPTLEYSNISEYTFAYSSNSGILLAFSLQGKTFKGKILEIEGNIKMDNIVFVDYFGNSIKTYYTPTRINTSKLKDNYSSMDKSTELINKPSITKRKKLSGQIILKKSPGYRQYKAKVLDDIRELEKFIVNDKTQTKHKKRTSFSEYLENISLAPSTLILRLGKQLETRATDKEKIEAIKSASESFIKIRERIRGY